MSRKEKIVKVLKNIGIATLATLTVVPAGAKIASEIHYKEYSNDSQVKAIAQALDCNLDNVYFMEGNYSKLLHNDNEPVYVTIDSKLDEYKPVITQSLDYMFNTIHSINENYTYEIVSKAPEGKSSIDFKENTLAGQYLTGYIDFKMPIDSLLVEKSLLNKANISIDLNKLQTLSDDQILYVFIHELIHAFGIRDVYTEGNMKSTNCHKGYSCININIGQKILKLSPQDIRIMLSLYSKQASNKNELNETIDKCKAYAEKYDEKYYNHYTKKLKTLIQNTANHKIDFTEFDNDFIFSSQVCSTKDNESFTTNYEIEYSNDKYTFKIFDENGKILENYTGEVVIKNDIMVLKNVTLEHGLRPNDLFNQVPDGYIQDLALFKNNDTVSFYNVYDNTLMDGKTQYIENELTI